MLVARRLAAAGPEAYGPVFEHALDGLTSRLKTVGRRREAAPPGHPLTARPRGESRRRGCGELPADSRGQVQRYPGRKRLEDRKALCGILFVLYTAIPWEFLPQELGFGSGMTCWRRLRDWHHAGVWERLHQLLLAELHAADKLDWSRAVIDSSHVRALKGGPKRDRARSTGERRAPSIM